LPPKRDVEHEIDLEPGHPPPSRPAYKLSYSELDEVKKQIDEYLRLKLIRPSKSPYGAPVLLVKKKNGSWRMCVDYRALNKITVKNKYALPRIEDLFDRVRGSRFFSKLDLCKGFHQIRVAEKDVHKTAFRTRYGNFEFLVMPFGLTNAPATCMRLMNDIFHDVLDQYVECFLDDVLIHSKTAEDHERHLREVLQRLRRHRLYVSPDKAELFRERIEFLGHYISGNGVEPTGEKIRAINEWPTPTISKKYSRS
jgi:hypothetical protein